MYSALETAISWVRELTELPAYPYVPEEAQDMLAFCIVERTGGELSYPHDTPEFTVNVWAKSFDEAEAQIMNLAAAVTTTPPLDDYHVNAVIGAPNVYHMGFDESGYDVWSLSFSLQVNLLDKE